MKLVINDKEFNFFSGYDVSLKFNSVGSTFSFSALTELMPKYLTYPECEIYNNDNDLLITGTIISEKTILSSKPNLFTVSGYSKAGILEDCNIPVSLYPLQSDKLSLKEITDKILAVFGLAYVVSNDVKADFEAQYKKSNASPTQSIKAYLNSLASQKKIILSSTEKGELFFTKVDVSKLSPIISLNEGDFGVINVSLSINGQAMHSEITIMRQAGSNPDAGEFTIKNPYVNLFRSKTKTLTSGDIFDVEKAARMELSAELRNIKFNISTTKFVKPGNLIELKSKSLGIKDFVELFVEQTDIKGDANGESYVLTCVLKEVYSMEKVKNIFI